MVKGMSSGAWLQIIIVILSLVSLLLPSLSSSLNLTQQPEGHCFKTMSDPITPLLKTLPWLPVSLRIEAEALNMPYKQGPVRAATPHRI